MTKEEILKSLTKEELVKLLQDRGDTVYIADRDLVRFAKFAVTLLAFFTVASAFFFGFDMKKASEEARKAADSAKLSQSATKGSHDELVKINEQIKSAKEKLAQDRLSLDQAIADAKRAIQVRIEEVGDALRRILDDEKRIAAIRAKAEQLPDTAGIGPIVASTSSEKSKPAVPLTVHVALVSEVDAVQPNDLARLASALQKQVSRDLQPIWNVNATIQVFKAIQDVPAGFWPTIIKKDIGFPGALGIHFDQDGKPYSLVTYSKDFDELSLTASHELMGMLVNPFGDRLIAAPSPRPEDQEKRVSILVEVASPLGGGSSAYTIDGVKVSDFVTPAFFGSPRGNGVRYSFTGAAKGPLSIAKGGFLSWKEVETSVWWQMTWFDGDRPAFRSLGKLTE